MVHFSRENEIKRLFLPCTLNYRGFDEYFSFLVVDWKTSAEKDFFIYCITRIYCMKAKQTVYS